MSTEEEDGHAALSKVATAIEHLECQNAVQVLVAVLASVIGGQDNSNDRILLLADALQALGEAVIADEEGPEVMEH